MEPTELQGKEINRMAWRTYRLVRAKQDVQADLELTTLGQDMVPVAHALVLGEFRNTPFAKLEWYLIGSAFVGVPLLVTLLLYTLFGTPPYWHDPAEVLIFYFGVFAAAFLIESGVAAVLMEARDNRLRRLGAAHPVHRTNEIAACALASATGKGAPLLGALLEAGAVDPEPTAATRSKLDEALIRLLPYCKQEDLLVLNSSQRRALWSRLARIAGVIRPARAGQIGAEWPTRPDEYVEIRVGVAVLKAYERLPDENAIGTVRSLANKSDSARCAGWSELIEAAKHCLPILEEIVRRSRSGSELLRGSDISNANADELLRPQTAGDTRAEELLRPAE